MSKLSYSVLALTRAISGEVEAHRFVGTDNARAGAGANVLGVNQHYANDEDSAVDMLGIVPIESGAAVTAGSLIESDAEGRAIDQTAGAIVGRALESSTAAGQFVLCQLIPN
ncbi:MAG: DUF2190 family protein [Neptuniibacter sp.]